MPPEAMIVRNSKFRSMTGSMTGWPHFLHSSTAKGAKSPDMNVLDWHRPQVTIFSGLLAPVSPSLTAHSLAWKTAVTSFIAKSQDAWAP
jgi:hypothetical protein